MNETKVKASDLKADIKATKMESQAEELIKEAYKLMRVACVRGNLATGMKKLTTDFVTKKLRPFLTDPVADALDREVAA